MTEMVWRPDANFELKTGDDVFSPKDLIELPRPAGGVANDVGDVVLVPLSKFSFKSKENQKSIWLAALETNGPPLEIPLAKGGDAFWLDSYTVGHVVAGEEGKGQELYTISVKLEAQSLTAPGPPALAGTFPAGTSVSNFRYSSDGKRLVFSAYVYSDVNLTTVQKQNEEYESRGNTAFVYDATYERHWDTWTGPKHSSLFTVGLANKEGKWQLGDDWVSLLKGTNHAVPVEPFGGLEDYDISQHGIIYTTKSPELPPAWHTRQDIIYLPDLSGAKGAHKLTTGSQGATRNPVFARKSAKLAWLELPQDGYESDRAQIVLYDIDNDVRLEVATDWDRSPDSITFSFDENELILTAGEEAHIKIFTLPVPTTPSKSGHEKVFKFKGKPVALTHSHAASSVQSLPNGRILFTQSSLTSPNEVFIIRGLDTEYRSTLVYQQVSNFSGESLKSKNLDEGESFWFNGAEGIRVHGWALKPKGWKEGVKKEFPVVLLIHGGPQGAWEDQWSTRWNPNVFAQQGYFVVAINPTGSTTFGQEFTDAIAEDWGGRPFVDLKKGWDYILAKYPEIDAARAVAAGASWGGYAINWIQGHPEIGFGFKALVCHDGVFDSSYNGFSTDELFFFNHEFGGRPWDPIGKTLTEKFSPSNFVTNWSTPQLIIHGSKDYRLPDTEGISAFHALQQLGIPSRLVIFPDENHWVLKHGNSLKWHFEVFRWFDKFVGKK